MHYKNKGIIQNVPGNIIMIVPSLKNNGIKINYICIQCHSKKSSVVKHLIYSCVLDT